MIGAEGLAGCCPLTPCQSWWLTQETRKLWRATSAPTDPLAPTWRAATPATAASADVPSHRSGSIAGDLVFEGLVRPAA